MNNSKKITMIMAVLAVAVMALAAFVVVDNSDNTAATDFASKPVPAKVHDWAKVDPIPDNQLYTKGTYKVVTDYEGGDNYYLVSVSIEGLKEHTNGAGTPGYWVGVAFTVPDNAEGTVEYKQATTLEGLANEAYKLNNEDGSFDVGIGEDSQSAKGFVAYYTPASSKLWLGLKWTLGNEVTEEIYGIDLDVNSIESTPVPAKIHDASGTILDKDLYKAGTYKVTPADAVGYTELMVSIEGLKAHQNAIGKVGYWVGVAFTVPADAVGTVAYKQAATFEDLANMAYTLNNEDGSFDVQIDEETQSAKGFVAYYTNESSKLWLALEWTSASGAVTEEIYKIALDYNFVATVTIDGVVSYYTDFCDAFAAAVGNTAVVDIYSDVTATAYTVAASTPKSDITVNLNSHKITGNLIYNSDALTNAFKLTINGAAENGANGIIEGGRVVAIWNTASNDKFDLTINKVDIVSNDYAIILYSGGEIVINDSNFDSVISIWGGNSGPVSVAIKNSTFTASDDICLYLGSNTEATLINVEATSTTGTALEIKSGTATITGGKYTGYGYEIKNGGAIRTSGSGYSIAPIFINNAYNAAAGTDGTFVTFDNVTVVQSKEGLEDKPLILVEGQKGNSYPIVVSGTLKGANLGESTAVTFEDDTACGKIVVDGKIMNAASVTIGLVTTYYTNMADALTAAKAADSAAVFDIYEDLELTADFINEKVLINLNGNTLTIAKGCSLKASVYGETEDGTGNVTFSTPLKAEGTGEGIVISSGSIIISGDIDCTEDISITIVDGKVTVESDLDLEGNIEFIDDGKDTEVVFTGKVSIASGQTLSIDDKVNVIIASTAKIINEGIIDNDGIIENGGTIENKNQIKNSAGAGITNKAESEIINKTGSTIVNSGTVSNSGLITIEDSSSITNKADSVLINNAEINNKGTIDIQANSAIDDTGTIDNNSGAGTVTIDPAATENSGATSATIADYINSGADSKLGANVTVSGDAKSIGSSVELYNNKTDKYYTMTVNGGIELGTTIIGKESSSAFIGLIAGAGGYTISAGSVVITGAIDSGTITDVVGKLTLSDVVITGAVTITLSSTNATIVAINGLDLKGGSLTITTAYNDDTININEMTVRSLATFSVNSPVNANVNIGDVVVSGAFNLAADDGMKLTVAIGGPFTVNSFVDLSSDKLDVDEDDIVNIIVNGEVDLNETPIYENLEFVTGTGVLCVGSGVISNAGASSVTICVSKELIVKQTAASFDLSRVAFETDGYGFEFAAGANAYYKGYFVRAIMIGELSVTEFATNNVTTTTVGADPDEPWSINGETYDKAFYGFAPAEMTYTVSVALEKFEITWAIYVDGVSDITLAVNEVEYGTVPAYGGATPSKTKTGYTYTFIGWNENPAKKYAGSIAPATADETYYAIFTETVQTFTVTWNDYDGTTLQVDYEVPYGTVVSTIPVATPADYSTGTSTFTFKAWTPSIVVDTTTVKGDITYTATYTETPKTAKTQFTLDIDFATDVKVTVSGIDLTAGEYYPYGNEAYLEVSFLYYNSEAKKTVYEYQGSAVFCADYVTIDYTNEFTGKSEFVTEYGNPVGAVVVMYYYQAGNYMVIGSDEVYKTMTVTFDENGGSAVADPDPVPYGSKIAEPSPETTLAGHTLVGWFLGDEKWNFTTDKVMTNITLKAKWSTDAYTVNFAPDYPDYGSVDVDKVTSVPYGTVIHIEDNVLSFTVDEYTYVITATPTAETAEFKYSFNGWSVSDLDTITGPTDITAYFVVATQAYTVTVTANDFESGTIDAKTVDVVYDDVLYGYTITIADGTITIKDGETPVHVIVAAANDDTAEYTYGFTGFKVGEEAYTGGTVTSDIEIVAQFTRVKNTYTVNFASSNPAYGSVEPDKVTSVPYGTVLNVDDNVISFTIGEIEYIITATPKDDTAEFDYAFVEWDVDDGDIVEGATTITATFSQETRKYNITWMNGEEDLGTVPTDYGTVPTYGGADPTKDATAQYTYTFIGWNVADNMEEAIALPAVTGNATYYAQYSKVVNTYTVVWKNAAATLETDAGVSYGTIPTYDGETPEKAATAQYTYTFIGWNIADDMEEAIAIPAVTGNATYYAQYSKVVNTYTVNISSNNVAYGTVDLDQVTSVPYGTEIAVDDDEISFTVKGVDYTIKATPTESTPAILYSFTSWNITDGYKVTGLTNIVASFDKSDRTYDVKWMNGESLIKTDDVLYEAVPAYVGATPTKDATAQYTYTFIGWNVADDMEVALDEPLPAVTADITYYAQYSKVVNTYTIVWKNAETTLETDVGVAYGTVPTYDGAAPTKASTAQYVYTFIGWNTADDMEEAIAIPAVTGNATYYAQYSKETRTYTVNIASNDDDWGTVDLNQVTSVPYGTKIYVDDNVISFTVGEVEYEITATAHEDDLTYYYDFDSWSIADEYEVVGATDIVATFTADPVIYSVTVYVDDELPVEKIVLYKGSYKLGIGSDSTVVLKDENEVILDQKDSFHGIYTVSDITGEWTLTITKN